MPSTDPPAWDAFLSHAAVDADFVKAVRDAVERQGRRCWMAPRDIPPGASYPAAIIGGITGSRALVVFLTHAANASHGVLHEVERAFHYKRPIVALRQDGVRPSQDLEFLLAVPQKMRLAAEDVRTCAADVVRALGGPGPGARAPEVDSPPPPPGAAPWRRMSAALAALLLVGLATWALLRAGSGAEAPIPARSRAPLSAEWSLWLGGTNMGTARLAATWADSPAPGAWSVEETIRFGDGSRTQVLRARLGGDLRVLDLVREALPPAPEVPAEALSVAPEGRGFLVTGGSSGQGPGPARLIAGSPSATNGLAGLLLLMRDGLSDLPRTIPLLRNDRHRVEAVALSAGAEAHASTTGSVGAGPGWRPLGEVRGERLGLSLYADAGGKGLWRVDDAVTGIVRLPVGMPPAPPAPSPPPEASAGAPLGSVRRLLVALLLRDLARAADSIDTGAGGEPAAGAADMSAWSALRDWDAGVRVSEAQAMAMAVWATTGGRATESGGGAERGVRLSVPPFSDWSLTLREQGGRWRVVAASPPPGVLAAPAAPR